MLIAKFDLAALKGQLGKYNYGFIFYSNFIKMEIEILLS